MERSPETVSGHTLTICPTFPISANPTRRRQWTCEEYGPAGVSAAELRDLLRRSHGRRPACHPRSHLRRRSPHVFRDSIISFTRAANGRLTLSGVTDIGGQGSPEQ